MVRFSRVGLAAVPLCHSSGIRSRQLRRHAGGNALKSQDHREGVVLENNNEYLTQLPAEGPPLFRSLLESLREYSMIKFFVLDVLLGQVVAASTDPAPDRAFAPSFFGRPPGQLP